MSISQLHLHPCELLVVTPIPVLVLPAVQGPHSITTDVSSPSTTPFLTPAARSKVGALSIPQSMASSVTHLLFLCRGHQVRRGHGIPHGAALAGQEQPLQGEAQLHHTLFR